MELIAKISGPLENHEGFFLCKGKYGGEEWSGIIQQKGDKACLVVMKKQTSKLGKQKIISYGGEILAPLNSTKINTKVEFKGVSLVLREERRETSNEDLAERLQVLEKESKQKDDLLDKATATIESMAAKMEQVLNASSSEEPSGNADTPQE